jgi:peptide/nickel transport system permease protein
VTRRTRFILRRLALTVPVLAVMSVVVFLVLHLVPGDPAQTILGLRATPEAVAQVRADLRLEDSLPEQYVTWIGHVLQGDLGRDFVADESVGHLIGSALPTTIELALGALLLGIVLGVPVGIAAVRGGKLARRLSEGFVVAGIALPDFWIGIVLILVFATALQVLPPSGYVALADDPVGNLRYFVLPVVALGLGQATYFARTTRSAVEDAMRAPYVLLLRAKGVPERAILWRHVLRNAAAPIVTVIGIVFGVLLGGAIVIESLFSLPGLGRLLVSSVEQRNYTVVQGCVLVIAFMFILVNLLTDIVVGWLDPRVADSAAQ